MATRVLRSMKRKGAGRPLSSEVMTTLGSAVPGTKVQFLNVI